MATILTKRSNTASSVPVAGDLTNSTGGAELAVNTADKRLFTKDSGGTVVELGTNPSSVTLPNGTANGVPYLNGSKVLTSGSALTFDGTNFQVANGDITLGVGNYKLTANDAYVGFASNKIAFNNSADQIKFSVLASEQMRLTSTGLGIGTSSPSYKLEIYDATNPRLSLNTGASGNSELRFSTPSSGYQGLITYSAASNFMAFYTSASERMRLDSSGNLGIGTSSPAFKLHVNGEGLIGGDSNNGIRFAKVGSINYIQAANSGAASELHIGNWYGNGFMRLDSSGNLGLGVTPSAWYTGYTASQIGVNGSVWANRTTADTNIVGIGSNQFLNAAASARYYISNGFATRYEQSSGEHRWYAAPSGTAGNAISFTQAMTLFSNGNLAVNSTTAPGTDRVIGVQGASSAYFQFGKTSVGGGLIGSDIGVGMQFYTYTGSFGSEAYTERARIDSSGNFGIGVTTVNYPLTVAGASNGNTITAINNSSNVSRFCFAQYGTPTNTYTNIEGDARSTGYLAFRTNDTERARIDSSGNLLVGTTSGSSKLTVAGVIQSTSGGVKFPDGTTQTTAAGGGSGAKAWVNFNGTTGSMRSNYNVSSVTRNAAGDYTVNFTTAMSDANYSCSVTGSKAVSNYNYTADINRAYGGLTVFSTTYLRVIGRESNTLSSLTDLDYMCVAVFN